MLVSQLESWSDEGKSGLDMTLEAHVEREPPATQMTQDSSGYGHATQCRLARVLDRRADLESEGNRGLDVTER